MLIGFLIFSIIPTDFAAASSVSPTESFIINNLYNPNQTIATRLTNATSSSDPDTAGGREALSESLGLWMKYALSKNDKNLFDTSYQLLNSYFTTSQGSVYWKLSSDGTSHVTTNAMIDDHIIIESLYTAFEQWKSPEYKTTADKLSNTSKTHNMLNGYFVDYYDFNSLYTVDNITLSYIVPSALNQMLKYQQLDKATVTKNINLLKSLPTDNSFFPKSYVAKTKKYIYDNQINMIDQVYIALHRAENGVSSPALYTLLKTDFYKHNQLVSGYDRLSKSPNLNAECPGLYGLTILYALEAGDQHFAVDLYNRMIMLRVSDQTSPYYGGYVFDNDSYSFNNLYALVGEQTLINLGLVY